MKNLHTCILYNGSGITYCLIAPLILGVSLLYPKEAYKSTLSVIAYTGLFIGTLNVITWFVRMSESW